MTELKLARSPDRATIKLVITVTPDLHHMRQQYRLNANWTASKR